MALAAARAVSLLAVAWLGRGQVFRQQCGRSVLWRPLPRGVQRVARGAAPSGQGWRARLLSLARIERCLTSVTGGLRVAKSVLVVAS